MPISREIRRTLIFRIVESIFSRFKRIVNRGQFIDLYLYKESGPLSIYLYRNYLNLPNLYLDKSGPYYLINR